MNIRSPTDGAPATAIAVYSRAAYRLTDIPDVTGSINWSLSGDTSTLKIEGPGNNDQVVLVSLHRSEQPQATTLTATFTPSDQSSPSTASLTLTVFAASIGNASGASLPVMTLGLGNRARYLAVATPDIGPLSATWSAGQNPGIAILNSDPSGNVEIVGDSVTQTGHDVLLSLTLTAGDQVAKAVLPIVVFGIEIDLAAPALGQLSPISGLMGVGETRVATARFVPSHAQPPTGTTWAWTVGRGLQALGNSNGPTISFVANASGMSAVQAVLSFAGNDVRNACDMAVFGVSIVGDDGAPALPALAVGSSARFHAVVEPAIGEVQILWQGASTVTVQADGSTVQITGACASGAEGEDGLSVLALIAGAQAHALVPLTVYETAIAAPDGGPPQLTVASGARQRYAVTARPALSEQQISWAAVGKAAAISGSTTDTEVEVVAIGQSEQSGDVLLGVSVVPPGVPHRRATSMLQLTIGTQRRQ